MEKRRSAARGEWVLLGLTGAFLCLLLGLFLRDRAALGAPASVETGLTARLRRSARPRRPWT